MKSFVDLGATLANQPPPLGARLAMIDTWRGHEQMYADQVPELLLGLAEQTRVASITASNAIEGVVVSADRAQKIVRPLPPRLRTRSEREFAGYRDAIDGLMRGGTSEVLGIPFILHLHRQLFAHADGRGGQLKRDQNLIVRYEDGKRVVLFTPTPPDETSFALGELGTRYEAAVQSEAGHPVLLIGLFVLDVDVSDFPVGAVLQQEEDGIFRVIGYSNRVFNSCKRKYCITRKELSALIFGLKQYR